MGGTLEKIFYEKLTEMPADVRENNSSYFKINMILFSSGN